MTHKYRKRCLTFLVIRKAKIKITVRSHYKLTRMVKLKRTDSASVGEDVRKELPYCVWA